MVLSACQKQSFHYGQRMKYFLQVNELYRVEQKLRVNDSNEVGGKSEVQYSGNLFWKKNEYGDVILIVRNSKDGQI